MNETTYEKALREMVQAHANEVAEARMAGQVRGAEMLEHLASMVTKTEDGKALTGYAAGYATRLRERVL